MADIWYRGEAEGGASSRPGGGHLHDLGEGVYFQSELAGANNYANRRAKDAGNPDNARVYEVDFSKLELGPVLDLRKEPRWSLYLARPWGKGKTYEQLIKEDNAPNTMNEHYAKFFEDFLDDAGIRIERYNAVIGKDYVKGGLQLCILLKNGKETKLHQQVRGNFRLILSGGKDVRAAETATTVGVGSNSIPIDIPTTNSKIGRMAANQNAMAILGTLLGSLALEIGDIGIERQARDELRTKHSAVIAGYLANGQGVLVIVSLAQWQQPDFNGMRARRFLGVYIRPGASSAAVLKSWKDTPQLLQAAPEGWDRYENYSWIAPGQ